MSAWIDDTGNKYGKLTVLERAGHDKHHKIMWLCRCDCGNEVITTANSLRRGKRKSCGCSNYIIEEIPGSKYGLLTVLQRHHERAINNEVLWSCRCDCGNLVIARGSHLRQGRKKSCGCLQGMNSERTAFKHIFRGYYYNAPRRGLEFTLTLEDFIVLARQKCHYCGIVPSQISTTSHGSTCVFNGIDRVDNSKGYILDNVVPCCKTCNFAKKGMTKDEFINWVARIARHQGFIIAQPMNMDIALKGTINV